MTIFCNESSDATTTGGVVSAAASVIVIVKLALPSFPEESVTSHVTVVVPIGVFTRYHAVVCWPSEVPLVQSRYVPSVNASSWAFWILLLHWSIPNRPTSSEADTE